MTYLEDKIDYLIKKVDELAKLNSGKDGQETVEFNGYISQVDAIKKYRVSKDWFWRRRKSGQLPFKKLGAKVYYAKKDLFNLLKDASL